MNMTLEQVCNSLRLKFTSGNSIPVERATITRKEWETIDAHLARQSDGVSDEDMRIAQEGLEYFERAGDAGDKEYVRAIRAVLHNRSVQDELYRNACDAVEEWKRRALDAEKSVAQMTKAMNDICGPAFMGEPVLTVIDQLSSWPEDAGHENGNYECKCASCGRHFIGYKRRVTCRLCAECAQEKAEPVGVPFLWYATDDNGRFRVGADKETALRGDNGFNAARVFTLYIAPPAERAMVPSDTPRNNLSSSSKHMQLAAKLLREACSYGVPKHFKASAESTAKSLECSLRFRTKNAERVSVPDGWIESLCGDLVIECERAMRQRDEFLKTGNSKCSHGGSHDTCFGIIVRRHLELLSAERVRVPDGFRARLLDALNLYYMKGKAGAGCSSAEEADRLVAMLSAAPDGDNHG